MAKTQADDKLSRNGRLSGVQVAFAVILAFGLILAINFSSRIAAGRPLQDAYVRLLAEVQALEAEQATLTAQRDFSLSDAYVEQWARSEGKMLRDGEVLVVPVPVARSVAASAEPLVPTIPVQTLPPEPENWTLWWGLFFDVPPPWISTSR